MTRYEAIIRQLGDIEKSHERALTKRDMQIRILCGYRDELEERVEIAARMIADPYYCSVEAAMQLIDAEYERRGAARKVAVT